MSEIIKSIVILFCSSLSLGLAVSALNLPAIIGYMISGVFLGSFMSKSFAGAHLDQIGDLALMMLMFIAGLHLEISGFVKSGKTSLKFVSYQMLYVILLTAFVVLTPFTIFSNVIRYGYIASLLIIAICGFYVKAKQIENFTEKNHGSFIISMILIIFFGIFSWFLLWKIVYKYKALKVIYSIYKSVYWSQILISLAALNQIVLNISKSDEKAKYQKITIGLCLLGLMLGFYDFMTIKNPLKHLAQLKTFFILRKRKIIASCIASSYLFISAFILHKAIIIAKYKVLGTFILQIILTCVWYLNPSIHQLKPLFAILKFEHLQIIMLCIGLLSFHSTAIAFKLMETKPAGHANDTSENLQVTKAVTSFLIGQDLLFMLFVIGLKSFGGNGSLMGLIPKLIIAIGILYFVKIICKARPAFITRFISYMRDVSIDLVTLFSLTFCFVSAYLADICGFSHLYGAFIAGLTLGNVCQYRSIVLASCEPVRDILMVCFFIHIGFLLDMRFVIKNIEIVMFINLFVIIIKYMTNYQSAKIAYKDEMSENFTKSGLILMSILMTQMTEFSLMMIDIVSQNLHNNSLSHFFNVLKSSSIVSLTFGCLVTVLTKRYLYYTHRIYFLTDEELIQQVVSSSENLLGKMAQYQTIVKDFIEHNNTFPMRDKLVILVNQLELKAIEESIREADSLDEVEKMKKNLDKQARFWQILSKNINDYTPEKNIFQNLDELTQ